MKSLEEAREEYKRREYLNKQTRQALNPSKKQNEEGMKNEYKKLVDYILDWWKEHECDSVCTHGEEYCLYDEEPSFVILAKALKDKEE